MQWQPVIGLEVHVQLATRSKLFGGASTAYGARPNTQACDVSIALPGVLPVMNREAARLAVRFGLGIGARINLTSRFDRKNYFYPDLPKGYQISQLAAPVVGAGRLAIDTGQGEKVIGITRAHLEEDAGKSLHEDYHGMTGIDLNRAGTPLLEIVSEPDMRSAAEAVACLRRLHALVRYLDVSDGNMQEGSFRCDANVSVRPAGSEKLGTRTELKNINSFRFVEKAIEYEIRRQVEVIEGGGTVVQETRLYDSERDETRPMRSKEDAHDYRYFPDPDLPPMVLDEEFIESVRATLPELPDARRARFESGFALPADVAARLVADRAVADYFERVCDATRAEPRVAANWMLGDLAGLLNEHELDIGQSRVSSEQLAGLLDRVADDTVSGKIAKEVFAAMWDGDGEADDIIRARGLEQISDSGELEAVVEAILADSPDQVRQFREGNEKVLGYLVGQVMKRTAGKANPRQVNGLLRDKLK